MTLDREVITPKEAAQILRCSRQHIQNLYHQGNLEGYRVGNRAIRIYVDSLQRWVTRDAS